MFCKHVPKKPDRKGDRPYKMTNEFYDKHEYHKRQCYDGTDRTDKMVNVFNTMSPDTIIMGCKKNRNCHCCICIYVTCRGGKSRDKTHDITDKDEHKECAEEREEVFTPAVAYIILG